jgi:F-type H+-transporting ATPase subunit b
VRFLRERREHYEAQERENAETAAECERLKTEYEEKLREADDLLGERRREAEREMTENAARYVNYAKAKADAIVKAAEEEAEARKEHILESAQTEIGELVLSATEKLLGDTTSAERDSALYDEFIRTAGADSAKSEGGTDE